MMYRKRRVSRSKPSDVTHVSSILKGSFKKLKMDVTLWEYEIFKVWNDVVGKVIAARAQPFRVIGFTLYVKVSSAPWMQELDFMKEDIRVKLNGRLEGKKVKEIIFKPGRWDKRKIRGKTDRPPWVDVSLDKKDEECIRKDVLSVKDPELKAILLRVRTLEKRLNMFKKKSAC